MRAVLERDFLSEAVRPRAFVVRTVIGGAASLALLGIALGGAVRPDAAPDQVGRSAFRALSVLLLGGLALVTPALLAGSLVPERTRGTLVLLLAAPLRPTGIALAKFAARSGTALLWASAALPPLSIAVLFGGVAPGAILDLFLAALAVVVECGALALLVSAGARGLADAAFFVYLLPLLRWGGTLALAGWLLPSAEGALLLATVPLAAAFPDAFGAAGAAGTAGAAGALPWLAAHPGLASLLAALLLAPLPVLAAGALLAREGAGGRTTRTRRLRPSPLEDRVRERLTRGNPVAWKESLLLHTGGSRVLYYTALALLLAGEAFALAGLLRGTWGAGDDLALLAASSAVVAAVAALSGAVSIAQETTNGTMELLRCSLLTPREIAGGKALGLAIASGTLLLVPAAHALLAGAFGALHPAAAAAWLATTAVMIAVHGLQGMRWGAAAPAPWAAVAGAVAFPVLGHLAPFGLCFAVVVAAAVRGRSREDSSTAAFCDEVAVPGLLCIGTYFVVHSWSAGAQDLLARGSESVGAGAGIARTLGGIAVVVPLVLLATRWRTLPSALERQMRRVVDGERPRLRLFRPGAVPPVATPGPGAPAAPTPGPGRP